MDKNAMVNDRLFWEGIMKESEGKSSEALFWLGEAVYEMSVRQDAKAAMQAFHKMLLQQGMELRLDKIGIPAQRSQGAVVSSILDRAMNPFLAYADECLEVGAGSVVLSMELYADYERWCWEGKIIPMGRNRFYEQVLAYHPAIVKTLHGPDRRRHFIGLKKKQDPRG